MLSIFQSKPLLAPAKTTSALAPGNESMLDGLQHAAFHYSLTRINLSNGLVADTSRPGSPSSIAAVGFVLSAYPIGVEHGWIAGADAVDRVLAALRFFSKTDQPHKHPAVQVGLGKHPRFNRHFTPNSASWLKTAARFFRDLTTERLRRGVFASVPELVTTIDEYVAHHNKEPKPFIWTKSARDILQKGHSRQSPLKY